MDLSIIIVNYKTPSKTIKCLQSLKEADWADLLYEIIVVDNGSGDDSAEIIAKNFPDIKLIRSEKNLGMGGGNNLGIKNSSGEFILILNADTMVEKDSVLELYKYLKENKEVGIVGPKIFNPDGSLQDTCMRFPKIYTPLLRRTFLGKIFSRQLDNFLMKDFDHLASREVDWLMGSCFLLRREILAKDGYVFDEKFFMYFEDTELCRRVKNKHQLKVVYFPEAIITHDHGRGSAKRPWYLAPFIDRLAREHIKSWWKYFFSKK